MIARRGHLAWRHPAQKRDPIADRPLSRRPASRSRFLPCRPLRSLHHRCLRLPCDLDRQHLPHPPKSLSRVAPILSVPCTTHKHLKLHHANPWPSKPLTSPKPEHGTGTEPRTPYHDLFLKSRRAAVCQSTCSKSASHSFQTTQHPF